MNLRYRILLLTNTFFFSWLVAQGQRMESTTGHAQVRVETNMTQDQCKVQAHELAIINAIENVFGTYVEQQTDIVIKDGRDYYNIVGTTKVKGEWIETHKEEFSVTTESFETRKGAEVLTFVNCKITGKVRKATPKAMIRYQTLNCPDERCYKTDFYSGESLYLLFQSPIDGYLSVFLEDEEMVYRLFPYSSQSGKDNSAVFVKADKEYLLFSRDQKNNPFPVTVDEYELFTTGPFEFNNIYVVFSEESFVKPILNDQTTIDENKDILIPKSLSKKDFQDWLSTNRATNQSFLDARIRIKIENK